VEVKSELSERVLLLLVAFLLFYAPNCHLSLVLASVVQGDVVNCKTVLSDISTGLLPLPLGFARIQFITLS